MPGLPDDKQQQVALVQPAMEAITQPRQPQNLQGLLRYAMEAQAVNAAPVAGPAEPLNEENKQFLHDALRSMTVDVIGVMQSNIASLRDVADVGPDGVPAKIAAFERILEYVDNIDVANDFHKIGGLAIVEPCMRCAHAAIRAHACNLVAELAQNNPYLQGVICERTNSIVPLLVAALRGDESVEVRTKALYAISCIARESVVGYTSFKQHGGHAAVCDALAMDDDRLRTKAAFLLNALLHMDRPLASDVLSPDFLAVLTATLHGDHRPSHEHILELLTHVLLLDGDGESKRAQMDVGACEELRNAVRTRLECVRDKEEHAEEQEYCEKIQRYLAGE